MTKKIMSWKGFVWDSHAEERVLNVHSFRLKSIYFPKWKIETNWNWHQCTIHFRNSNIFFHLLYMSFPSKSVEISQFWFSSDDIFDEKWSRSLPIPISEVFYYRFYYVHSLKYVMHLQCGHQNLVFSFENSTYWLHSAYGQGHNVARYIRTYIFEHIF